MKARDLVPDDCQVEYFSKFIENWSQLVLVHIFRDLTNEELYSVLFLKQSDQESIQKDDRQHKK